MRQRINGISPVLARDAYIHPSAMVIGDVTLGKRASVWPGAVVRGDIAPISIGERTNIQDGAVLHTGERLKLNIGSGVTVGHRAVLHSCDVEDGAMVGMGAIVLDAARIGAQAIVGAGALVPQGFVVPPRTVVVGSPCRVLRDVTDEEIADMQDRCERYAQLAHAYLKTGEIL